MSEITSYAHGQFNWVDLTAPDLDQARTFYRDVLGWEAEDQDTGGGPPYVIFRLHGKQGTSCWESVKGCFISVH